MAKKATDPFMAALWSAMLEEKLPPGGHETSWGVTSTRIRNRFAKAVRQAMQSGAAFSAIPARQDPCLCHPRDRGAHRAESRQDEEEAALTTAGAA